MFLLIKKIANVLLILENERGRESERVRKGSIEKQKAKKNKLSETSFFFFFFFF